MSKDILVVDDEEAICDFLKLLLEEEGYSVSTAHDGIEALNFLSTRPGKYIVVLDIMMPRMDGRELLNIVRTDPALRSCISSVIVMSASHLLGDSVSEMFGKSAEMISEYVTKPFEIDDVIEKITAISTITSGLPERSNLR